MPNLRLHGNMTNLRTVARFFVWPLERTPADAASITISGGVCALGSKWPN